MPKIVSSEQEATNGKVEGAAAAAHPYHARQRWLYVFEDRFGDNVFAGYPLCKVLGAIQARSNGRVVLNETRAFEKARRSDHAVANYNGFRVWRAPVASVDWGSLPQKCQLVIPDEAGTVHAAGTAPGTP